MESDLSALHRIDDMHNEPAHRMTRLALRVAHYQGAVRARALMDHERRTAAAPAGAEWVGGDIQSLRSSALADVIS